MHESLKEAKRGKESKSTSKNLDEKTVDVEKKLQE
jgi:hypothetical protein